MGQYILKAGAIVELVRLMRSKGYKPSPEAIMDLAVQIMNVWLETDPESDGSVHVKMFVPPLYIDAYLGPNDIEKLDLDGSDANGTTLDNSRDVFRLLKHDDAVRTIEDKGRFKIREATPNELNQEGLDMWNDYVESYESGDELLVDLKPTLRTYVLDTDDEVGYLIAFERVGKFGRGEIAVPKLANKKVMIVDLFLLKIDGESVAVSPEASARTFHMNEDGKIPAGQYEAMQFRNLERAMGGQHVSIAENNEDQVKNADLLTQNKRFEAEDYPLFFDDVLRLEILGEKVQRCKRSLPR